MAYKLANVIRDRAPKRDGTLSLRHMCSLTLIFGSELKTKTLLFLHRHCKEYLKS